ncbi:MAG: flavodoxin family protein [Nitrospiraceae bacterium]|nr:flavodoxin family protein [Nitrospiraceae bacterium]
MKTAVFMGSPRIRGNTHMLLEEAMRGAMEKGAQITFFELNAMKIKGCQDCGSCVESGLCVMKDDMEKIYPVLRESSRFILASPIFFVGVSAQTKAMIDRCQCFWYEKYILKKPLPQGPEGRTGLFLSVGGMGGVDGKVCSEATAKAFFRTISVLDHRALCYLGVDARGDILKKPQALKEAYEAGRKLMEIPQETKTTA